MSANPLPPLRAEIESSRPLHGTHDSVTVRGWCLEGDANVPAVRLVTDAGTLTTIERHTRSEFGGVPCGFTLRGILPPGIHVATFEAQRVDGTWSAFCRLTLRVDPPPFAAALEWPLAQGTLTERARPAGWAVHPRQKIESVSLRFGHCDAATDFPSARPDVAALFPQQPTARESGFMAREKLPAGHGPLRIRARLANGTVAIARTDVSVAIPADENTPAELDLAAPRLALPGYERPRSAPPATPTARPRNILFVLPGTFASNSALHAASLANELSAVGHHCALAVSEDPETLHHHASPQFAALTHAETATWRFPDGRGPDVVQAWTTRESVRRTVEAVRTAQPCRLVVHLEDNEQQLLALTLGRSVADLEALPAAELDRLVPPDLSHPQRSRAFLASADGVTVIVDRLREFVPAGLPCLTLWPAADERFFFSRPLPEEFRRVLDPRADATVLFYHGNVHAANAAEMRELYAAVALLNDTSTPTTLLRTGLDAVDFLGTDAARLRQHVIELGQILHHRHLPPLMALADCFVQPGLPDAFNDYRFPSKLPEFFALGRPVILPRTNLGNLLRPGVDAMVLDRADAAGIAQAVRDLRADPALARTLAAGAAQFAATHFSWRRSAAALANFHDALAPS